MQPSLSQYFGSQSGHIVAPQSLYPGAMTDWLPMPCRTVEGYMPTRLFLPHQGPQHFYATGLGSCSNILVCPGWIHSTLEAIMALDFWHSWHGCQRPWAIVIVIFILAALLGKIDSPPQHTAIGVIWWKWDPQQSLKANTWINQKSKRLRATNGTIMVSGVRCHQRLFLPVFDHPFHRRISWEMACVWKSLSTLSTAADREK